MTEHAETREGPPEGWVDPYLRVQDFLDTCSDIEKHVALVRLAMRINNGDQHFDHGEPGYSWLCHRCALDGSGGLNGWVGALRMLGTLAAPTDGRDET